MVRAAILRTMSRENVEVVQRAYEAWNRGDPYGAAELLAPDVEWRMPPNLPDPETWRSSDEVRGGIENFLESWTEFRAEVEELIDAGDRVVALVRFHGRAAHTGLALESNNADATVWTLRDGLAVKVEMYSGTREAFEAVGLSERR
jgi:ketosteroid isomerase-like protein